MVTGASSSKRIVYEISLIVTGSYAVLGQTIHPSAAILTPLRIDLMALTFLGVCVLLPSVAWARRVVPWIAAGGLLGAAFVAPWAAVPWLVVPALAMAWAGRGQREGPGTLRAGVVVALLAAITNSALVAGASARGVRISPEDFATRDFRVNRVLVDVPLHDAWAIDLKGHDSPTLEELGEAFKRFSPFHVSPAVMGLGMLREVVGFAFGWGNPRWFDADASFVHRLSETDRRHSTTEPGTTFGSWRVLYACPQEGVAETINGTVHVAVAATIGAGTEGPRLFLSFRVREVNWTTPFYMRLIDPARRFFVYPFLLKQFAHTWERGDWDRPEEIFTGEEK